MTPRPIVFQDTGGPAGYGCAHCNSVWLCEEQAARCCESPKCIQCGVQTDRGGSHCEACGRAALAQFETQAFRDAAKLLYVEYDLPYLYWGATNSFYRTKTEIERECETRGVLPPRWVWGAEMINLCLDAEAVLSQNVTDANGLFDHPEISALQGLLTDWASDVPVKNFRPDYSTAVVLDSQLYEEFAKLKQ